jgi:nucleoporin GLE1
MASPSRRAQQAEFTLVLHRSQRSLYDRLDFEAAERAKAHHQELSQATIKHESVLRGAQLERERLRLQEEHERKEREEQQLRENERLRQLTIDAQRRTEEAARKAAEQQRLLQEADARLKAQKEQAEAAQKQQQEQRQQQEQQQQKIAQSVAAAKAQKEIEAAAAAEELQKKLSQQPSQAPRIPPTITPQPATAQQHTSTVELIHRRYLELHRRMKAFRTSFAKQHADKRSPLKAVVGDMRRAMRLRMGQVTVDRKASVAAIAKMREEVFDQAKNTPGPMVDIRHFIISHPIPTLSNEADARYPALLLYAFCVFTKSLLKQFEAEAAGEDGRIIQEMGLIAASLLADQKYMWNGIPMTDIVMAKYHNACPILFGLRATMDTPEGQARLGWKKIHGEDPQVSVYHQYMTGLGCGFAALSLRQFSGKTPAIPMAEYWRALASICNTPSENLYGGHFKVLQGLLRDYAKKFLIFYGVQARGVLRKATVDLPARAPPRAVDTANLVAVLKDGWLKNENISLD